MHVALRDMDEISLFKVKKGEDLDYFGDGSKYNEGPRPVSFTNSEFSCVEGRQPYRTPSLG